MTRRELWGIFIRSLTIHASFNFWRLQHLGFLFALLPLIRAQAGRGRDKAAALSRHLQIFSTHPYLAAPIIGSVVRLELDGASAEASRIKDALMGPYAGIGDAFFWGALRTLASVVAVLLALCGSPWAPAAFLLIFNPPHFWIRIRGFWEGIRQGKNGIGFIARLDLPFMARRIRMLALPLIGVLAAVAGEGARQQGAVPAGIGGTMVTLLLLLLFYLGIRRGISVVKILYGTTFLCLALSL